MRIARCLGCAMLTLALTACGDDSSAGQPPPQGSTAAALSCVPQSQRACPCAGGGSGAQSCAATGDAYGPCMGCPPPPMQQPSQPAAGTSAPATVDAGANPMAGQPGTEVPPDGGATPDGGTDSGSGEPEPMQMAAAPGTSCGVGLPVLCALDSEKCCVRSLETDTCIGATDSCSCDTKDCTVMEVHCDGPEDCPDGQQCCGTLAGGFGASGYDSFECATSCDYAGSQRIACHQETADCPGNNVCANSQLLTNIQVCIDPSTIQQ